MSRVECNIGRCFAESCPQEGTTNEESAARAESAHPALIPPFEEESISTLRQDVVQLRMENASAVAHIATLEVCRSCHPLIHCLLHRCSFAVHRVLVKLGVAEACYVCRRSEMNSAAAF